MTDNPTVNAGVVAAERARLEATDAFVAGLASRIAADGNAPLAGAYLDVARIAFATGYGEGYVAGIDATAAIVEANI